MKAKLTVQLLLERMRDVLQLRHIEETAGLDREISSPHVSSPGLALAGYTERFASHRLQVFGETEITYLRSLDDDARRLSLAQRARERATFFTLARMADAYVAAYRRLLSPAVAA